MVCVIAANIMITNSRNSSESSILFGLESVESLAQGESGGKEPICAAGGCHSEACSFEGEIAILANGVTYKNSTSCIDAWACCFTTAYCFPKNLCSW